MFEVRVVLVIVLNFFALVWAYPLVDLSPAEVANASTVAHVFSLASIAFAIALNPNKK